MSAVAPRRKRGGPARAARPRKPYDPTVVKDDSAPPTPTTYDNASRLVDARRTRTNDYNTTYSYDAVGNTLYSGENATTTTYDDASRLVDARRTRTNATNSTYNYDAVGATPYSIWTRDPALMRSARAA